ncbi:hypothetical protein LguiA_015871 [Lonicera macranthoides]
MRDYNSMFMKKMLEIYGGFEGLKSLVDVGDGDGTILNLIASNYPAIKDTNFDLAQIIEKSPSYPGPDHGQYFYMELHHWSSVPLGAALDGFLGLGTYMGFHWNSGCFIAGTMNIA